MKDKLISIRQAAIRLKSTPYTIQQLVIDGKLKTQKSVSGKHMIFESSIEKYQKELQK